MVLTNAIVAVGIKIRWYEMKFLREKINELKNYVKKKEDF